MSEKRDWKVGDRCAVYSGERYTGTIEDISVRWADGLRVCVANNWVHEKQCRRLKPRAKAREWWLVAVGLNGMRAYTCEQQGYKNIHVREVLPPKKRDPDARCSKDKCTCGRCAR